MNIEKPITPQQKENANKLYRYLREQTDYVTKQQIGEYLGVYGEREVRDIISLLATKR